MAYPKNVYVLFVAYLSKPISHFVTHLSHKSKDFLAYLSESSTHIVFNLFYSSTSSDFMVYHIYQHTSRLSCQIYRGSRIRQSQHNPSLICFGSLLDSAREIQTAKQMNGNQKWPSYCETYEINYHRRWKGDDGIYFGYRFWFHCLYEQNRLFLKLFFHDNGIFGIWFQWFLLFCMIYCITVKKPIDTSKSVTFSHSCN